MCESCLAYTHARTLARALMNGPAARIQVLFFLVSCSASTARLLDGVDRDLFKVLITGWGGEHVLSAAATVSMRG